MTEGRNKQTNTDMLLRQSKENILLALGYFVVITVMKQHAAQWNYLFASHDQLVASFHGQRLAR